MSSPGISVSAFLRSLSEGELRGLIDSKVLSVLDAFTSGERGIPDLASVASAVVDFETILASDGGRLGVVRLLSPDKQSELAERLGLPISEFETRGWGKAETEELKGFFGLVEERRTMANAPSTASVRPIYGLFDHQRSAVTRLESALASEPHRCILHLPTGVGKTRTAMHLVASFLRDNEPSIVVWLASGRELLEQAVQAFGEAWSALGNREVEIGRMWGDQMPQLDAFDDGFLAVGLAKGWSTMSGGSPEWAARLASKTRLVVFDEAHQSVAATYRQIVTDLTLDRRCALLGLTATPGRTWADIDRDGELAEFYGHCKVGLEVPGDDPIGYLVENGYLARTKFRTLFSEAGICLDGYELEEIAESLELPTDVIDALSLSDQYLTAVLGGIESLLAEGHQRILVFAASVAHARILSGVISALGTPSAFVTGKTPQRERDRTIRRFTTTEGPEMVLVNFGVLTTGFDAPKISAVLIARPTQSLVLYSQMVGRATRGPRAGGTEECVIVTVVDLSLPGFGDVATAFGNWEDVW